MNLIIGILLVVSSIIFLFIKLTVSKAKKKKIDPMMFSYDVEIYLAFFTFFIAGLIMIYKTFIT